VYIKSTNKRTEVFFRTIEGMAKVRISPWKIQFEGAVLFNEFKFLNSHDLNYSITDKKISFKNKDMSGVVETTYEEMDFSVFEKKKTKSVSDIFQNLKFDLETPFGSNVVHIVSKDSKLSMYWGDFAIGAEYNGKSSQDFEMKIPCNSVTIFNKFPKSKFHQDDRAIYVFAEDCTIIKFKSEGVSHKTKIEQVKGRVNKEIAHTKLDVEVLKEAVNRIKRIVGQDQIFDFEFLEGKVYLSSRTTKNSIKVVIGKTKHKGKAGLDYNSIVYFLQNSSKQVDFSLMGEKSDVLMVKVDNGDGCNFFLSTREV
jgi:hypothetical protein